MRARLILIAVILLVISHSIALAGEIKPLQPAKKDKCPVCGMFIYKYPDWVGEIIFNDGSAYFFDGAKDLFKYFFDLKKYNPGKTTADISAIYVTEYYDMQKIDAKSAFFVIGSDVFGPMGKELIPFKTREDAEQFKKDHSGTGILTFEQVKPDVIEKLD
jgi:copper chaperone NosL